jgi:hypothetical protein
MNQTKSLSIEQSFNSSISNLILFFVDRYYSPKNELIAESKRQSLTSGGDHWETSVHIAGILPPAIFIFTPAFKSINTQRGALPSFGTFLLFSLSFE